MPASMSGSLPHVLKVNDIDQFETHLHCRLSGRACDLHIVVHYRGLVLQGRAPTYYVKQLAQHVVMEATELPILANGIEVP